MNGSKTRYRRHNRDLLKFFTKHLIVGLIAGEGLLTGLLVTNAGGLRTLIWNSTDKWLALILLAIFFAITFGSLAMGSGVMGLRNRNEEDKTRREPCSDKIE